MNSSHATHLAEMIAEGVWILDPSGQTRSASARMHAILGCGPESLDGRPFQSFLAAASQPIGTEMIAACTRDGEIRRAPLRLIRDGGPEIDTLVSMRRIDDGILATVLDITERTQLRALFSLRGRLQRAASFDELANAAFDAFQATLRIDRASIQIFDADGSTTFLARRGLSDTYVQTIESRWRSNFDPNDPKTFVSSDIEQDYDREPLWREILAEGIRSVVSIPLVAQARLIGKLVIYDGKPRPFAREEIELAETIANHVAFAIDRMQAETALREGKAQLDLALRASKTGTWSHDFATGRVTCDDLACEVMGVPKDRFEFTYEGFRQRLHPEDRDLLPSTTNAPEEFVQRFRVITEDGSVRHVESRGRSLKGPDGSIEGFVGVCLDVTRETRLQEEKARFVEKLQQTQKLESLGVMAGGIAHDFNNLLVGILGTIDLVREDLPPGSPLFEPLAFIETAARRAANLAQQMLAYSGRGRVEVRPIDLTELVQEMAQLLGTVISKKAEMTLDLARDLPPVKADPTQIRQVVMNLITNASDALAGLPGGIVLRTSLRSVDPSELAHAVVGHDLPAGQYASILVSDTGCGMDSETLTKIFEPFFTTKFTGRGLGLAAVLGIVRGHGGAILVDTAVDRGTTFEVLLPPGDGATGAQREVTVNEKPLAGKQAAILVVDDEALVRITAERILKTAGFRVRSAGDGKEAIDLLASDPSAFDLVLLDMTMPLMNGDEALREMRRIRPDLRAVIASGFADTTPDTLPENAEFIAKPYTASGLLAKVRAALER